MDITIENKVKEIIQDLSGVDLSELVPGAKLYDDLGIDSLDLLEIVCCIEKHFNIIVNDDDMYEVKTFGELIKELEKSLP